MTPALVAAVSQPRARVRWSGSTESETYAWITPVVPPPIPCTKRDTKRSASDRTWPGMRAVSPKRTKAAAARSRLPRITGRRPRRSESRPHSGALVSWAKAKTAISRPMVVSLAP